MQNALCAHCTTHWHSAQIKMLNNTNVQSRLGWECDARAGLGSLRYFPLALHLGCESSKLVMMMVVIYVHTGNVSVCHKTQNFTTVHTGSIYSWLWKMTRCTKLQKHQHFGCCTLWNFHEVWHPATGTDKTGKTANFGPSTGKTALQFRLF